MRIDAALKQATESLADFSETARLDAELLLSHYLDKGRSYLFAWPEVELTDQQLELFNKAIAKRKDQYPVAYLIGHQEFWSLKLEVSEAVLIPRADTELLVETALDKLQTIEAPSILEMGTGSGAIALALASERIDSKITATDLSQQALDVAIKNKHSLNIENVHHLQSNWFEAIGDSTYDLIISNPPYIDPDDKHMQTGIRFEPLNALVAPNKGLADLEIIISGSSKHLKKSGWLMLEHGYDQGDATVALMKKAGYNNVACLKDLQNNDRITIGQLI
ncbi:peptide chain release factor N(5)-glutamine methyltransferase [Leucothrix sargassi]|nr:peptide chain release factor N(5)-glutamine methyltransferase [Leucothrix sargassi]